MDASDKKIQRLEGKFLSKVVLLFVFLNSAKLDSISDRIAQFEPFLS